MDSIHSWVNEEEVKRLAEGLGGSPKNNKRWTNNAKQVAVPTKQVTVNKVAKTELVSDIQRVQANAKVTLAEASAMAKATGLISSANKKTDSVASSSLGTFELVEKMFSEEYATDGICVIDRDGDVLYDTLENASLTQFSKSIMVGSNLMSVAEGEFGNMRIKATAETVLEYISIRSTRGPIVIIANLNKELTPEEAVDFSKQILKSVNS